MEWVQGVCRQRTSQLNVGAKTDCFAFARNDNNNNRLLRRLAMTGSYNDKEIASQARNDKYSQWQIPAMTGSCNDREITSHSLAMTGYLPEG
jgi:hypothetical protein